MEKNKYVIKNSLGMFDLIKGMIMMLVMLLHTYMLVDNQNKYSSLIELIENIGISVALLRLLIVYFGSIAMPAMFIMSGYGFRKTSFDKCVRKQFKMLIFPFAVTAAIVTVIYCIMTYLLHFGWLRYTIIETFRKLMGFVLGLSKRTSYFGIEVSSCGSIWFLLALFIGTVIFNFLVERYEGNKLLIMSFIVAFVGWLIGLKVYVPWSISQALVAVFFLCIGYTAKKKSLFTSPISAKRGIIMAVVAFIAILMACVGDFHMSEGAYTFGPLAILVFGICGAVITHLSLYLNKYRGRISNFLRKIGSASLYVLCIHTIERQTFGSYFEQEFTNIWKGSSGVRIIIIFGVRTLLVISATFCFLRLKGAYFSKKNSLKTN